MGSRRFQAHLLFASRPPSEKWNQLSMSSFSCGVNSARELIMGSTSDKVKGKANEVAGKARQAIGKAVDNHEEQAKGKIQETKGKAQVAKGEAKDAVKNLVDKT